MRLQVVGKGLHNRSQVQFTGLELPGERHLVRQHLVYVLVEVGLARPVVVVAGQNDLLTLVPLYELEYAIDD